MADLTRVLAVPCIQAVRAHVPEGLAWQGSQKEEIGYGVFKLRILCIIVRQSPPSQPHARLCVRTVLVSDCSPWDAC